MNACCRCILFMRYYVCSVMINWLCFLNVCCMRKIIIHYGCVPYCLFGWFSYSFIHFVVCLMKSPQLLPQQVLHSVKSSAYSSYFQYPLIFWIAASSCLCFLLHLPIFFSIFPTIKCCVRQFLGKMWPMQLACLLFVCRMFLSSFTLCKTFSFITRTVQLMISKSRQWKIQSEFILKLLQF